MIEEGFEGRIVGGLMIGAEHPPVTIDYVNPEHPWPALEDLKKMGGGCNSPGTPLHISPLYPQGLVLLRSATPYKPARSRY